MEAAAIFVVASEAPVAVQAVAMLVVVGVLALCVAFLVRRSRERSRQRRDRYEQAIARLPREYHPHLEHKRLWVAGYAVTCAVVSLVGSLVSDVAAIVLSCVTFLPGTLVLVRMGATRNRRILDSVRSRAGQLDVGTLIGLIDSLEEVYGADMRPLRSLPPAGSDLYQA